jgi:hypothetical protein
MGYQTKSARVAFAMIAVAALSVAQGLRTPDDITPLLERTPETRSKTDGDRFVGKVLAIDPAQGSVKLSTEEGERTVKAPAPLLGAIRVGDTVSIPRADSEPASASPRGK